MRSHIIGYHTTQFGELWDKSLFDLVEESILGVLKNTHIEFGDIDAIFFGNMLGGILENNLHAGAKIADIFGLTIPIFRVEGACASGGMAFHLANEYVQSGKGKTVLVIGAEKMTDVQPEYITQGLMSAASGEEQESGMTFPGLYALMARVYLKKFGYDKKNLAAVAVKNHKHGFLNPTAHFRKIISEKQALESSLIADPLGLLDCSPVSDGAASLIITTNPALIKRRKNVKILSSQVATDSISLLQRDSLIELKATQIAAEKAFSESKIKRSDISIAEVHDCFTIAELFAMEDLGFWKKGEAGRRVVQYETLKDNNGPLIINTSGGLKASGHPVGATGIKQIGELYIQLTNQADKRQIKNVKYGLAHNVGGSGGTAVVTIVGV
ncbi:MAG: thiolase domain-containing protein [Candidatus Roizmanbacteria bacterium]|nr:thiolase domain-containing protein [Candidatus Roizmanbacteria bacterium]